MTHSFPTRRSSGLETHTGRVFYWDVTGPGQVSTDNPVGNGGHLLAGLPGMQFLDSLAVDGEGWVCVGTLVNGAITAISPDGETVDQIPMPDPLVTTICFGGPDMRTAYVTLSRTGALVSFDCPRRALRLPKAPRPHRPPGEPPPTPPGSPRVSAAAC